MVKIEKGDKVNYKNKAFFVLKKEIDSLFLDTVYTISDGRSLFYVGRPELTLID
jgi:hypothetical protein